MTLTPISPLSEVPSRDSPRSDTGLYFLNHPPSAEKYLPSPPLSSRTVSLLSPQDLSDGEVEKPNGSVSSLVPPENSSEYEIEIDGKWYRVKVEEIDGGGPVALSQSDREAFQPLLSHLAVHADPEKKTAFEFRPIDESGKGVGLIKEDGEVIDAGDGEIVGLYQEIVDSLNQPEVLEDAPKLTIELDPSLLEPEMAVRKKGYLENCKRYEGFVFAAGRQWKALVNRPLPSLKGRVGIISCLGRFGVIAVATIAMVAIALVGIPFGYLPLIHLPQLRKPFKEVPFLSVQERIEHAQTVEDKIELYKEAKTEHESDLVLRSIFAEATTHEKFIEILKTIEKENVTIKVGGFNLYRDPEYNENGKFLLGSFYTKLGSEANRSVFEVQDETGTSRRYQNFFQIDELGGRKAVGAFDLSDLFIDFIGLDKSLFESDGRLLPSHEIAKRLNRANIQLDEIQLDKLSFLSLLTQQTQAAITEKVAPLAPQLFTTGAPVVMWRQWNGYQNPQLCLQPLYSKGIYREKGDHSIVSNQATRFADVEKITNDLPGGESYFHVILEGSGAEGYRVRFESKDRSLPDLLEESKSKEERLNIYQQARYREERIYLLNHPSFDAETLLTILPTIGQIDEYTDALRAFSLKGYKMKVEERHFSADYYNLNRPQGPYKLALLYTDVSKDLDRAKVEISDHTRGDGRPVRYTSEVENVSKRAPIHSIFTDFVQLPKELFIDDLGHPKSSNEICENLNRYEGPLTEEQRDKLKALSNLQQGGFAPILFKMAELTSPELPPAIYDTPSDLLNSDNSLRIHLNYQKPGQFTLDLEADQLIYDFNTIKNINEHEDRLKHLKAKMCYFVHFTESLETSYFGFKITD